MEIDEFIEKLSEYKSSDTVHNMYYGNSDAAKKCRENLKQYLEQHKNSQILLVGEAPGYKGCARTGVPFTSDDNEVSAGVIQTAIKDKNVLMWNAFPFHPHKKGNRSYYVSIENFLLCVFEVILQKFSLTYFDVLW